MVERGRFVVLFVVFQRYSHSIFKESLVWYGISAAQCRLCNVSVSTIEVK